MAIYLDVVWLLNFLVDWMLLMLTQSLARDSTNRVRIMLGAVFASMIVPLSLYFPGSILTTFFGKILYSVAIILIAFKFRTINHMVKCLLLFYFMTFAIGGGLVALHYMFQSSIDFTEGGTLTVTNGFGTPISWTFVVIGFPIVWWFTKLHMDRHASDKIQYEQLVSITLTIDHMTFSTTGFIDSGNQLTDPLTRHPVIIGDAFFMKQWFSDTEWETLKQASGALDIDKVPRRFKSKVHVVPYQGIEGSRTFMMAFKPDQLEIQYANQTLVAKNVLVGIQFSDLSIDNSYHCLLHPQIIQLATVHSA